MMKLGFVEGLMGLDKRLLPKKKKKLVESRHLLLPNKSPIIKFLQLQYA